MISLVLALATSVSCITEVNWENKYGNLKQIQAGPLYYRICGVSDSDDIFCADPNTFAWYQLPGKLAQVTIAEEKIYGVTANQDIFYSASNSEGRTNFVQLPGKLKQISFDGKTLCGTTSIDTVVCANKYLDTNPNRFGLPGLLKQVIVRGDQLFGVSRANLVYASPTIGGNWTRLTGYMRQVTFDGKNLCGTDPNNNAFCANENLNSTPNWDQVPGQFSQVSVGGDGKLVALDAIGEIFAGALPATTASSSA